MLYPRTNEFREVIDLSGFFDFKLDAEKTGKREGWQEGVENYRLIAVPGSWNEQFLDTKDYLGSAWYFKKFFLPSSWREKRIWLRIGEANYYAKVWINGKFTGEHEGGYLPFQFEISRKVEFEKENLLSIEVNNELSPTRVPPGNIPDEDTPRSPLLRQYPNAHFDFFPYGGIQREVYLFSTPKSYVEDIGVITKINGKRGIVQYRVTKQGKKAEEAFVHLVDNKIEVHQKVRFLQDTAGGELVVDNVILWCPENPHLYKLVVELFSPEGSTIDKYSLSVGIRTVEIKEGKLHLNGKPIFLRGFGKHEDFPITGRGLNLPLIVKDYSLMKWIGANSFRTSHYPHSEQTMDLADREGFLVIDEIPAVGLFFGKGIEQRLALCKQYLSELVARDKNHPSVIIWSVANEPHPPLDSKKPEAKSFFKQLYDHTKKLDSSRLVTVVTVLGSMTEVLEYFDLIGVNAYHGWYSEPGQLDLASQKLDKALDELYRICKKPIIQTEFGAGAIAGMHALPPEMFSEEYQAEVIKRCCQVIESKPYMAGEHVWSFADFKTPQSFRRVILNRKGVFTRTRQPKLAAHLLKRMWSEQNNNRVASS